MRPEVRVRRFKLRRGRQRSARPAIPGPAFYSIPWRRARVTWEYRRRYVEATT